MALRRFLGLDQPNASTPTPRGAASEAETATIRRIVTAIEAVPEDQRRYLAAFAYVLGRVAHADLSVSGAEREAMERVVVEVSGLPESQAVLVVEIAHSQNELYGGTEDYLVTRTFRDISDADQRLALLRSCFGVAAAGSTISAEESRELDLIARELDIPDTDLHAIRGTFTESFEAIHRMRGEPGRSAG